VPPDTRRKRKSRAREGIQPWRLFSDREAAAYIGASKSYIRALIANGTLPRVELPATNGGGRAARMLRLDVADLDAFVERLKARTA